MAYFQINIQLKNHVGETYNTLEKGSTGKNIRHNANALAKTLKSAFPMLEKDPQYVSAEDLINSGFGVMPLRILDYTVVLVGLLLSLPMMK